MLYQSSLEAAPHKRVLLGMSGLGKTFVSNMLRASGDWFHYSVDYRIGTRYMGEFIADSFKRTAMQVPYLRSLCSQTLSILPQTSPLITLPRCLCTSANLAMQTKAACRLLNI